MRDFWPVLGPQWAALGKTHNGIILIEAKANIPEFISPACGASANSLERIRASLKDTQQYMGINPEYDWTNKFYQVQWYFILKRRNGCNSLLWFDCFYGSISVIILYAVLSNLKILTLTGSMIDP